MFKKIALATDGSAQANKAAKVAADLAASTGAQLTIINVLPTLLSIEDVEKTPQAKSLSRRIKTEIATIRNQLIRSPSEEVLYPLIPAFQTVRRELSKRILDDAQRAARSKRIKKIERVALDGDPAREISKRVKKMKADLIVVGARGLGNFDSLLFGSVSRKVAAAVSCPTLIVK